jgi:hypothetical protein
MIEFEVPEKIAGVMNVIQTVAVNMMRPVARYFDEHEHEIPWSTPWLPTIGIHGGRTLVGGCGSLPVHARRDAWVCGGCRSR